MKYESKRIDLIIARELLPPAFNLPIKTPDLIADLYEALNPRFPLRMEDLRSYGGTTFKDVRVAIRAFNGNAEIEVFVHGYKFQFFDLIQSEDDVATLEDFSETTEEKILGVLDQSEAQGRLIQGRVWLECEGGTEAVDELLRERGNRAIDLATGSYKDFDNKYTLYAECDDTKGLQIKIIIQRSEVSIGNMYVDTTFMLDSSYDHLALGDQINLARSHFVEILARIGLKSSSEATS